MSALLFAMFIFATAPILANVTVTGADSATDDLTRSSDGVLTLDAPKDFQVIQRQTVNVGVIWVRGTVTVSHDQVDLRLQGNDMNGIALPAQWVAATVTGNSFASELTAPAGGWYTLSVRAMKDGQETATTLIDHVGVGEVFVGAGQSNSTSCGGVKAEPGQYPLDGRTQPQSGLVSSFDGETWGIANDPQPGAQDNWDGGSFWPSFGDAMAAKYNVPIGVAVTGRSSSSVTAWQKGDTSGLFDGTLARMNQLGQHGFRAVLWHQGETDYSTPAGDYAAGLAQLIADFRADVGWEMPWFVANASYMPGKPVIDTNSRGGQQILWENGTALEGPDTDQMVGDLRDHGGTGIHFSKKGLKVHGEAWAKKVGLWLDLIL